MTAKPYMLDKLKDNSKQEYMNTDQTLIKRGLLLSFPIIDSQQTMNSIGVASKS